MSSVSVASWIRRNLAVACGFLLLGLLAARLPTPLPGLLALWPGAGLALVAALISGWRLMPGVALGSIALSLLNYGLPAVPGGLPATPPALYSTLGITCVAAAVVAQSLLAATLARRYTRLAVADDQPWSEFHALLFGALSCALSAATRALLLANGDGGATDEWLAFGVAWAGGASGVLVIAPLALAAVFRHHRLWRQRVLTTLLPSLLAMAGVLILSAQLETREHKRLEADFASRTYTVQAELQQRYIVYRRNVLAISRFWQSSERVRRDEFRLYVTPILTEFPALRALEWLPVVSHAQRAEFERSAQADGAAEFVIRERAGGVLMPAQARPQYLPVLYVEPMTGNEAVFGFDIASVPDRGALLQVAQDRNAPTGSPPLTLIQDAQPGNGLLIILPVYTASGLDVRHARSPLGFAVSVYHIDRMMKDIVAAAERAGTTFAITDITDAGKLPVFRMPRHSGGSDSSSDTLTMSRDFDFGGRLWRIDYANTPVFAARDASIRPWLTLVAGCLLVGLLQALLLAMSGQASLTRREVERRTHELHGLADLSEALQSAPSAEAAQAVMVAHIPRLFASGRGGLLVVPPGSSELQELVTWGNGKNTDKNTDKSHGHRVDIPLEGGGQRLGLLWLEQAPTATRGRDEAGATPVHDVARSIVLALGNLRLRDALRDQAIRDVLTGLYNRRYLAEVCPQILASVTRQKQTLCVAQMDIDHFKRVNDTYGHDAGDRVLKALAVYLRSNLRAGDLCFRLGGEEFALLLPNTALADGVGVVDTLRAGFSKQEFHFGDHHPVYRPTFSAGVSEAPRQSDQLDSLLKLADDALYRAKDSGRNRVLPAGEGRKSAHRPGDVTTHMPGNIVTVLVKKGDAVKAGQPVLVTEAMKMEAEIQAPVAGTVAAIHVKKGDRVNPGEVLIEITP